MSRQKRWRDKQSDEYRQKMNTHIREYQKTFVGEIQLRASRSNTSARSRGAKERIGCGDLFAIMMKQHKIGMATPCNLCGVTSEEWDIDHILPIYKGGMQSQDNLQIVCKKCHSEKSAKERNEKAKERREFDMQPELFTIQQESK